MGALLFAIGVLILFSVMMGLFLVVPFFLFLAGIVAMVFSDRKRDRKTPEADKVAEQKRFDDSGAAEAEAEGQSRRSIVS